MVESTIVTLGTVVMILTLAISIIPFVPGPALVWAVGVIVAVAEGFNRVTVLAVVIMTILMLLGSTTELWLRALGMKSKGASCWSALGSFVGGLIGTLILPIIGTLIGAVIGALLVEFMRIGEFQQALNAGKSALQMFLIGMVVEFGMSLMIFLVFVGSIWITA